MLLSMAKQVNFSACSPMLSWKAVNTNFKITVYTDLQSNRSFQLSRQAFLPLGHLSCFTPSERSDKLTKKIAILLEKRFMISAIFKNQTVWNSSRFVFSSVRASANEAVQHCSSINGRLAEFSQEEVRKFVRPKLIEEYISEGELYITAVLLQKKQK